MKVKVKKGTWGFYALRRRREGEVFDISDQKAKGKKNPQAFSSKWMEEVSAKPKEEAAKPAPDEVKDEGPTSDQEVI